jgi:hypothetical protein
MLRLPLVFAVIALLTGCGAFSGATDNMRKRIATGDAGQTRNYSANQRDTYQAARLAAERMGYRIQRGGAAQGFLEAVSGIGQGDDVRSSRQFAMKVALLPSRDEGTEVNVRLTEIIEAQGAHRALQATEAPLQGTPQYEVFFRAVQQALEGQGNR